MNEISVQELHDRKDVPLVDVREVHEYEAGHVPGAVNIPMSQLGERIGDLPAEPFDVICELGGRSGRVVEALSERGYEVTNVAGGTSAWREAGYPVEL
ncbi:rhodanese-like domain-containing protein [Microbacterium sp. MEC084]|jgi:rhodanese-related sulfurtransferase|uniref:rhodanese-like domain-containing protein n=1 Tax=unclassified Microbacterium TaxID=2609290 RepID=UPI0007020A42|nr:MULTISPECIES: rhodanese-like domain-containing protein [unclassified Microbacterium]KQY96911.1 sulfurtransferase [Microbacterium sp. Root53]MCD1268087.1 rhodanese-like domain-containing protein [Microbacterium sp. MEC084]